MRIANIPLSLVLIGGTTSYLFPLKRQTLSISCLGSKSILSESNFNYSNGLLTALMIRLGWATEKKRRGSKGSWASMMEKLLYRFQKFSFNFPVSLFSWFRLEIKLKGNEIDVTPFCYRLHFCSPWVWHHIVLSSYSRLQNLLISLSHTRDERTKPRLTRN